MSTAEVPRRVIVHTVKGHKVPRRTLDSMRERAAEEGVSLTSLIRRALDEWLEITEGQPRIERYPLTPDEPTQATPTVSVSYATRRALANRGFSDAVISRALDEWLML